MSVVIVGAGQAGFQAAMSLRHAGFKGRIDLVGEDPHLPYQRPPLSKQALLGDKAPEVPHLRPAAFYVKQDIAVRSGSRAVRLDPFDRKVHLEGGEVLDFEYAVLATGARARELPVPGAALDGVVSLRTAADARAVHGRLGAGVRVLVVGAGFIGLEVAAAARRKGGEVLVVEALERALSRAVSAPTAAYLTDVHTEEGVEVRCGIAVERFDGDADGRLVGATLSDGSAVPADVAIIGIGVVPDVQLADLAGLAVDDGIVVDDHLRTADPAIYAIGDCARFPAADGRLIRLESVQNAADQARAVGASIAGTRTPYRAVPWFWSTQHDRRLQIAGLATGHDRTVVRQAPDGLSVFCFRGGELLAIETVDRPKDHLAARKLLADGVAVTPEQAGDPTVELCALRA